MNHPHRALRNGSAGFTLIELLVVMTLTVILAGTSLVFSQSALPSLRADTQARRVVALMHLARESAIARRRDIEVQIDQTTNTIQLVRRDAGLAVPMETFVFESGMTFRQYNGLPDTPEGFGAQTAIDFGNSTVLLYDSEGALVDETGAPANGTIYLGIGESLQSARAVTVTGTTGRARLYRWTGPHAGSGTWER